MFDRVSNVRQATDKLLSYVEEGLLDRDIVILSCVKYMSEHEVADMCHVNGFFMEEEEDEVEDEDVFTFSEGEIRRIIMCGG